MSHATQHAATHYYALADQFERAFHHIARRTVVSDLELNALIAQASEVEQAYALASRSLSGRALRELNARHAEVEQFITTRNSSISTTRSAAAPQATMRRVPSRPSARPSSRVLETDSRRNPTPRNGMQSDPATRSQSETVPASPIVTLYRAIHEGRSIQDCFQHFSSLSQKSQHRIYQLLCAHFVYEAPDDIMQTGIDLFLEDHRRLVTPLARSGKCILQIIADEQTAAVAETERQIQQVIMNTPAFAQYRIYGGRTTLTSMYVRPANLFFDALLGPNCTTMPGSGKLFAFRIPSHRIRNYIYQRAAENPDEAISFSAARIPHLAPIYGNATYRLSFGEIQSTLNSQRIYLSPRLPPAFYRALKQAMLQDGIVVLPGTDSAPVKVKNLRNRTCQALIKQVKSDPRRFGFASAQHAADILDLTVYQLGSMVVKSEDFRIFMDPNGKILARNPGAKDAIRLLNACGIRGISHTPATAITNRMIMNETFRTALIAAENGIVIFPAVGMGIWGGDPDLYWRAFLDAVIASGDNLEKILVNPGHQETPSGIYRRCKGNEFQMILNEYRRRYPNNPNLKKIVNLYQQKTDVIHLAYNLKRQFPGKIISLFNASDPDVTLGYHVGEYTNNLGHAGTTEENYTAMGTNGLCFEGITQVHQDQRRIIQVHIDVLPPRRGTSSRVTSYVPTHGRKPTVRSATRTSLATATNRKHPPTRSTPRFSHTGELVF